MNEEPNDSYIKLLDELSELCGILAEYYDIFGNRHVTSAETKKGLLSAMGVGTGSPEDLRAEVLRRRLGAWKTVMDPVRVVSVNDQPVRLSVFLPVPQGEEKELLLSISVADESGSSREFILYGDNAPVAEEKWIEGLRYVRFELQDGQRRDIGYYQIRMECRHPAPVLAGKERLSAAGRLIVVPEECYLPPKLRDGRSWGLAVNLYALRSARNWGLGNFTDLAVLTRLVGRLGGDFVGLNPLHAIANEEPGGISPYFPLSRIYRNSLYLDVERIPEVRHSPVAAKIMASAGLRKKIERLRSSDLVAYEETATLQEKVLRAAFRHFLDKHYEGITARGRSFRKYALKEGELLDKFALFLALREYMKKRNGVSDWRQWPVEYREPSGPAVRAFRKRNERKVLFYKYVQWLIEEQLRAASKKTGAEGMAIGYYQDIAVGSDGGGSDAWCHQRSVACGVGVGAPPDDFSPSGQNWGFPPLIPEKLREDGYELFIRTIRKNMEFGGALRIDHALGLFRLFWIPGGATPAEGAYVRYPTDDLLGIVALESVRNRTAVIAEDLGTIGEGVRESLRKFGLFSYRLFYFERNYPDPSFLPPADYPVRALCAVTTHDLPTLYGYWKGRDIEQRRLWGGFSDDSDWERHLGDRKRDKQLMLEALRAQGMLPPGTYLKAEDVAGMTPQLSLAVYRYLAMTPCKLLLVSLDDVLGTMDQQNLPGVSIGYPNWKRKIPLTLDAILHDRRFVDLSEMFRTVIGR
jgi:4-alpha-glucanotransferase